MTRKLEVELGFKFEEGFAEAMEQAADAAERLAQSLAELSRQALAQFENQTADTEEPA